MRHYAEGGFSGIYDAHENGTLVSTEYYTYPTGDMSFRDQLTGYNGNTITYDGLGNPLTYNNGLSYTFTRREGRELSSVTLGGVTTSYDYNSSGIRISKTTGSNSIRYLLSGDKIIEFSQTEGTLPYRYVFTYDESLYPILLHQCRRIKN